MTTDRRCRGGLLQGCRRLDAPRPFAGPDMPLHRCMKAGERGVAGLMTASRRKQRRWARRPPGSATSTPTTSTRRPTSVKKAGGNVHREPSDIPDVGRFSVVADPQGAMFMLMTPKGPTSRRSRAWHARPCRLARALRRRLAEAPSTSTPSSSAGQKGEAIDMGAMGTYQLVLRWRQRRGRRHDDQAGRDARSCSGTSTSTSATSTRRVKRVTDNGGKITDTARWRCRAAAGSSSAQDPQGAHVRARWSR